MRESLRDVHGKMDRKEVRRLVRSMGDRMSAAQLDSAMESMDKEMTGEVDFDQVLLRPQRSAQLGIALSRSVLLRYDACLAYSLSFVGS